MEGEEYETYSEKNVVELPGRQGHLYYKDLETTETL